MHASEVCDGGNTETSTSLQLGESDEKGYNKAGLRMDSQEVEKNLNNKSKQGTSHTSDTSLGPTNPLEASRSFRCYYCTQRFPSQNELIAHMDQESDEARESLGK
jgi:hypothetical protein